MLALSAGTFRPGDAVMSIEDLSQARQNYFEFMETIPAQAYLSAALGSVGLSFLLRLFGKKDAAVFVGQWPTTILLLALAYKLLKPSHEDAFADGEQAAHQASQIITSVR
jgi:hypothetical protein